MAKCPKSKLKSEGKEFLYYNEKRNQRTKIKTKKSLKMERKIQVLQDKLKQECLYQCLQQYEEKENKNVIIPSYVEI